MCRGRRCGNTFTEVSLSNRGGGAYLRRGGKPVKLAKLTFLNYAKSYLKKQGYWVYALEADGENIYKQDFTGNVALVIGGEDSGVKRLTRERCDKVVSLPLFGKVNSLNASVALGIAAYEVVKCRLD